MDLRELRKALSEIIKEAETLRTEVLVQMNDGKLCSIVDMCINDDGDVIIETE